MKDNKEMKSRKEGKLKHYLALYLNSPVKIQTKQMNIAVNVTSVEKLAEMDVER